MVHAVLNWLRTCAVTYAEVLQAASGWGNPFEALEDDEDEEGVDDAAGAGPLGVRLTLRADFVVDPSVENPLEQIEDLMHRDWPPQRWDSEGLICSNEAWQVTVIEGTPEPTS